MRASATLRADSTCGFGSCSFKIDCFSISLSIPGNWPVNDWPPTCGSAQPRTTPTSNVNIGFSAITEFFPAMNVGLLMILIWGEATANKISFGDCEANQDRAENFSRRQVPGRIFAHLLFLSMKMLSASYCYGRDGRDGRYRRSGVSFDA